MKVFCFVFTIYILFLSFQPCEEMTANAASKTDKAFQRAQMRVAETDEKSDNCSPFCICSCCHFSTAYQFGTFTISSRITTVAILSTKFSYQNPYSKAYKNSIWQPPKFNSRG
jgi:hypothetical protein